jgi:hypothetical protein
MVKSFYTIKDIITSKKKEIMRPSTMPYQEFSSLTKEEKRQLFNIVDIKITHEEYLELNVGFLDSCEYV